MNCPGMGARREWPKLRGVRGKIVRLYAPNVEYAEVSNSSAQRTETGERSLLSILVAPTTIEYL